MKVQIDSLVRGKAGNTGRVVEGRVYAIKPTFVGVILTDSERQAIIYEPEVIDKPRPLNQRTDIPTRLR